MNNMQDDINSRALQTSLDATNQQLQTTTAIATDTKSKMDTIYNVDSKQLKATGFVVLNGTNTAGIMTGSADGIEFQTSGGTGYSTVIADDVRVPVLNGGNADWITMKTMNSLIEDTKTEKDELRRDFDALKETFDNIINIDNESGRNVYSDSLVTSIATVDDTLTVGKIVMKNGKFEPEDSDGNLLPARF